MKNIKKIFKCQIIGCNNKHSRRLSGQIGWYHYEIKVCKHHAEAIENQ